MQVRQTHDDDYDPRKEIAKISANLEQPDKFAQIFCHAAENQKSIDHALKKVIKTLIKEDKETIEIIKQYQREVDKEEWRNLLRKIGLVGWSIVMIIVGGIVTAVIKKIVG